MKQIGQQIQTIEQGINLTLGFGSITSCFLYLIHRYPNSCELLNLAGAYGVLLTGQVAYNTAVLGFFGNDDNDMSVHEA